MERNIDDLNLILFSVIFLGNLSKENYMNYFSAIYNICTRDSNCSSYQQYPTDLVTSFVKNAGDYAKRYATCLTERVSSLTSIIFTIPIETPSFLNFTNRDIRVLDYIKEKGEFLSILYGDTYRYCFGLMVLPDQEVTHNLCDFAYSAYNLSQSLNKSFVVEKDVQCLNFFTKSITRFCQNTSCTWELRGQPDCIPDCFKIDNNTFFDAEYLWSKATDSRIGKYIYPDHNLSFTTQLLNIFDRSLRDVNLVYYSKYVSNPTAPKGTDHQENDVEGNPTPWIVCGVAGVMLALFVSYKVWKNRHRIRCYFQQNPVPAAPPAIPMTGLGAIPPPPAPLPPPPAPMQAISSSQNHTGESEILMELNAET